MEHHADYAAFKGEDKAAALEMLVASYEALSAAQDDWVANLANCASLLWHCYQSLGVRVNWAGFYVMRQGGLLLGPFQGKVACQSIEVGRGVCGAAAQSAKTQLVPDVDAFPGHIACDGETKSELVVPIVQGEKVVGVLDLDCLDLRGFDAVDVEWLEKLATLIANTCKF